MGYFWWGIFGHPWGVFLDSHGTKTVDSHNKNHGHPQTKTMDTHKTGQGLLITNPEKR